MTPKEKAEELVELMKWEGEGEEEQCYQDFAKQCALIAVDEIIESNPHDFYFTFGFMTNTAYKCCDKSTEQFWQQVKNEIEKL